MAIPKLLRSFAPAVGGVAVGLVIIVLFAVFDEPEPPPEPPPPAPAVKRTQAPQPVAGRTPARPAIKPAPKPAPTKRDVPAMAAPDKVAPAAGSSEIPQAAPELPAWRRFAVPTPVAAGAPLIAVIIDDMGLDMPRSAQAVALTRPLTLSYLPYADQLVRQVEGARRAGHELMVHVSMMPEAGWADPGPNVLDASLGAIEVMRRIDWALGKFHGFVGVNNHMGSLFTADKEAMKLVLGEFRRRGLLFVDSRTTQRSVAPAVAWRLDLPFAVRDVFMDDAASTEVVAAQLLRTEEIARRTGSAIAIGHPRDATLAALRRWLPSLARRGFTLAPVSAVVMRRRQAPRTAPAAQ